MAKLIDSIVNPILVIQKILITVTQIMPDKILDNAAQCVLMLFEYIYQNNLDIKVNNQYPKYQLSLHTLTLAWLIGALDYIMTGEGRVNYQHRKFINSVLYTNFTVTHLNESVSDKYIDGQPFDYSVVPAFLLLTENVQKGSAANLFIPVAGLLRCACAWDGKRTSGEIARLEDVFEPIRRRFGIDSNILTPDEDAFWSNEGNSNEQENTETAKTQNSSNAAVTPGKRKKNEALAELDALIGLTNIKKEVHNISNLARYLIQRKNAGLSVPAFSMHMVFTGNPGTGKTTVARLIAEIYRDVGILDSGHLVEVDRAGLVGEYLGQTAPKTREVFMQAKGGVLFIDEAYSLRASDDRVDEFGNEAIATLLKLMEDHRDEVIVIVAGYTNEMKSFIDANVGLQSRFTRYLSFEDYTDKELTQIFIKLCRANQLTVGKPLVAKVYKSMQKLLSKKSNTFGNAREVRTFFEQTMQNHANRLATIKKPTTQQLQELEIEDIPR